jgi:serine/threonine protein kinase
MGVVLDARDPVGRSIALKLLRPSGEPHKNRAFAARFHREAKILKKLSHPGVVRLIDSGTIHGIFYLAMERVDGKALGALIKKGPMDLEAIIALGSKLGETLAHLHEVGVVHRDIKPDNVIIDQNGQPILTDFGLARVSGGTAITRADELVGSLGYIAPEVIEGAKPSAKTDQYAFGRLLFALGVHKPDVEPPDLPILEAIKNSMSVDWDTFPSEGVFVRLAEVIKRAIAHDPEERFPDMYSVTVELDAIGALLADNDTVPTDKFAAITVRDLHAVRTAPPRAQTQSAPPGAEVPRFEPSGAWDDDTRWDPDAERKLAALAASVAERASAPWLATDLAAPAALPEQLDWVKHDSSISALPREEEPLGVDTQDLMMRLRRRSQPYAPIDGTCADEKSDRVARMRKKTKRFWVDQLSVADSFPPETNVEPPHDAVERWHHIVEDLQPPAIANNGFLNQIKKS